MVNKNDDQVRCSFCNKTQNQVRKLIAGPNGTYICDECIEVCNEILEEEFVYDDGRAVSYTHLDVYKRQGQRDLMENLDL